MSEWQPAIVINGHNAPDHKNHFIGKKIHVREAPKEFDYYVGARSKKSIRDHYTAIGCDGKFYESKETFTNGGIESTLVLCEHEILTD